MTYFLAGCILTFAAMSVWLWRRERKRQVEQDMLYASMFRFGYERGASDERLRGDREYVRRETWIQ